MGHQARQAHQEDVPPPGTDTQNVFLCRWWIMRIDHVSGARDNHVQIALLVHDADLDLQA